LESGRQATAYYVYRMGKAATNGLYQTSVLVHKAQRSAVTAAYNQAVYVASQPDRGNYPGYCAAGGSSVTATCPLEGNTVTLTNAGPLVALPHSQTRPLVSHMLHIQGLTPTYDEHGESVLKTPKGRYVSDHVLDAEERHRVPSGDEIDETVQYGTRLEQANGRDVYIREGRGGYIVVIDKPTSGRIVTAIADLSQHDLDQLGVNYGYGR